jgi:hypothetical protein
MPGLAPWRAVLAAAMTCAACGAGEPPAPSPERPVPAGRGESILFIGNSLTYANDLPGMVQALAASVGVSLPAAQVAYGGYSLSDHLARGDAARAIAQGGWRIAILQQGPSGQPDSRIELRRDTRAFDRLVRAAGARTALFSVWADSHGPSSFEEVQESYALAAADVDALYFPVNEAWSVAFRRSPALRLYSDDGFHPSQEGSYLAALVIASAITGVDPERMPAAFARADGSAVAVPAADAEVLRDAAAMALSLAPPVAR